jgi:MFS family permease
MTARADQSASHKISDRARLSLAALAAGGVGNLLEWYDFGLYGYFAPVLARQFFPSDDPLASLIGAYGSFAVGFAMRPIGAAVLGTVGDRVGRRFVPLLSVTLMGVGTTAIALLPTYEAAGIDPHWRLGSWSRRPSSLCLVHSSIISMRVLPAVPPYSLASHTGAVQ